MSPRDGRMLLMRLATLCIGTARAQTCCAPASAQLQFDKQFESTVEPGAWVDFYFIGENEGDSIAFELSAESINPTALGVYVYDGKVADSSTAVEDQCLVCGAGQTPVSDVPIVAPTTLHASGAPSSDLAALDMDTVSRIGNTTHRRYFTYVGECYHMVGSVYYLSVYGQTATSMKFFVTAKRVISELAFDSPSEGSVCDGKYMHYFFNWELVQPGGALVHVKKTSGELDSFYVRYEHCAGASDGNLHGPINIAGFGLSEGQSKLPSPTSSHGLGRYYIAVRGSTDLCGHFTVEVRNLTQKEYHAASSS